MVNYSKLPETGSLERIILNHLKDQPFQSIALIQHGIQKLTSTNTSSVEIAINNLIHNKYVMRSDGSPARYLLSKGAVDILLQSQQGESSSSSPVSSSPDSILSSSSAKQDSEIKIKTPSANEVEHVRNYLEKRASYPPESELDFINLQNCSVRLQMKVEDLVACLFVLRESLSLELVRQVKVLNGPRRWVVIHHTPVDGDNSTQQN